MGQYGPHSLDLPKDGAVEIRDGVVYFTRNGQPFGRLLVGPDGVTFDGIEVAIAQEGDPAALTLMTRGNRGCGKLSFKEVRGDARGEEVAFIRGALAEDAVPGTGDYRGQVEMAIRPTPDKEPELVFIGTTHATAPRRIWTGSRNFVGPLRGFAYPGDSPPPWTPQGVVWELRNPDGVHWCVQQADGNFVGYRNRVVFDYGTGEPVFDWFTIQARLAQLTDLEARVLALEAR